MSFSKRITQIFNNDLYHIQKDREEQQKKRGESFSNVSNNWVLREKYFEALRIVEKGGMTDYELNQALKRASFYQDLYQGKNPDKEAFLKEDLRLSKIIEKEKLEEQ